MPLRRGGTGARGDGRVCPLYLVYGSEDRLPRELVEVDPSFEASSNIGGQAVGGENDRDSGGDAFAYDAGVSLQISLGARGPDHEIAARNFGRKVGHEWQHGKPRVVAFPKDRTPTVLNHHLEPPLEEIRYQLGQKV